MVEALPPASTAGLSVARPDASASGTSASDISALSIEVCFARSGMQLLRRLQVAPGCTIGQAIAQSGILREAPEIDLEHNKVGVYGKVKTLETLVAAHDRIEIYRPLIADPKDARRRRANKKA